MSLAMKMGLRNLKRRPTRTLLTGGMLAVSTLAIVFSAGISEGSYAELISLATKTWMGHFQVQAEGYNDSPSLYEAIDKPEEAIKKLEAIPGVSAVVPRVEMAGLLSHDIRTAGALITAVDPAKEKKAVTLPDAVKQGTWLGPAKDPEAMPIVIGAGLARKLKAEVGADIVYLGQASDGSVAAELFSVVGILESGSADMDAATAYVRLEDAQRILVLGGRVHRLVGILDNVKMTDKASAAYATREGEVVLKWTDLMPGLKQSIDADRGGGQALLFIVLLVVVLGVINSLLMSVFERTRELGIMKALGTAPNKIIQIILWESTWVSVVGVTTGVAVGALLILALQGPGIEFSEQPMEFGGAQLSVIHPAFSMLGTVIYPAIILVTGMLAGFWPARRAAALDPVAAIRHQ